MLGDSAENPRFIETLPRRGYRFVGPIAVNETDAAVGHEAGNRSTRRSGRAARPTALLASAFLGTVILVTVGGLWKLVAKRSDQSYVDGHDFGSDEHRKIQDRQGFAE